MKHSQVAIVSAIAGVLALAVVPVSQAAQHVEKCAGIAKAGKNDCGSSTNDCGGKVKKDRDSGAWVEVPNGTCEKIAGGKITVDPNNRAGGKKGK